MVSRACRLSCPTACGILVSQPEIEPSSPALEGGFLTTGPPRKSHVSFQISVFFFFSDIYPGVKLLGHMVVPFLVFWEDSILFSTVGAPIYTPTNSVHVCYLFSTSLPTFVIWLYHFYYGTWGLSQYNKARIKTQTLDTKIVFLCKWYNCVCKKPKWPTKMPLEIRNEILFIWFIRVTIISIKTHCIGLPWWRSG